MRILRMQRKKCLMLVYRFTKGRLAALHGTVSTDVQRRRRRGETWIPSRQSIAMRCHAMPIPDGTDDGWCVNCRLGLFTPSPFIGTFLFLRRGHKVRTHSMPCIASNSQHRVSASMAGSSTNQDQPRDPLCRSPDSRKWHGIAYPRAES